MKHLKAIKCSDGWVIKITETHKAETLKDALDLTRQNGLEVRKEFSKYDLEVLLSFYAD